MRRTLALACLASSLAASFTAALVGACGGDDSSPAVPQPDATADSPAPEAGQDSLLSPGQDSATVLCTLSDMSDPVGLCTQKAVLRSEIENAWVKGQGVAESWDSTTYAADTDDAGRFLHSWADDVGFASALASYHCSAGIYGDNEIEAEVDTTLADVASLLQTELATPPATYDGEAYLRLRNTQFALFDTNDSTRARAIAGIADAYARAIATFARAVPGGGDAGDAGAAGMVLGTPNADGSVTYAAADAVSGAVALLDMAALSGAADASAEAAAFESTALAVLDTVWSRARDPRTGLFFTTLVTGAGPTDAIAPGDDGSLRLDVQARIVLDLVRAHDKLAKLESSDGGDAGPSPDVYFQRSAALLDALSSAQMWDGVAEHDAGTPGTYVEALLPPAAPDAAAVALTNRTTAGNALLLGGLRRLSVAYGNDSLWHARQLRPALLQSAPTHSSLFSVVSGQQGFFRAASRGWDFAAAPDGASGQEPRAQSYRAAAVAAAIEGLTQLWVAQPNELACVY
jgi:hypothetical protein